MTLSEYGGKQLTVRRIELELYKPTRDKETVVVILANVPKGKADALRIADLYLARLKIETAFQVLTTTLRCEVNTLGYPGAALFAFAVALLAYNAVIVVESAIRAEHGKQQAGQLSKYYMALEIAQAQDGLSVILEESDFEHLKTMSTEDFCNELRDVARHVEVDRYRKNVRGTKKPPTKKKASNKRNVHVSTAKILAQRD